MKIIESYKIPDGNVSPDIFKFPCVAWVDKTNVGVAYMCHDTNGLYKVKGAFPNDWICKDENGKWHVMHDDEYQRAKIELKSN